MDDSQVNIIKIISLSNRDFKNLTPKVLRPLCISKANYWVHFFSTFTQLSHSNIFFLKYYNDIHLRYIFNVK